jgi:hypothetical protein
MNAQDIVKTMLVAIQNGNFETARTYLSDDFVFSGPVPEPINREQWLGMSANLLKAFPDLDYRFATDGVNGDVVNFTAQLTGTHKGSLDLTAMGMGIIPATGKTFKATRESGKITVKNGKIVSLVNPPIEGAGLMAILSQLGVTIPSRS